MVARASNRADRSDQIRYDKIVFVDPASSLACLDSTAQVPLLLFAEEGPREAVRPLGFPPLRVP